jgi:hypothetical protein
MKGARNEMIDIEQLNDEQLEQIAARYRAMKAECRDTDSADSCDIKVPPAKAVDKKALAKAAHK